MRNEPAPETIVEIDGIAYRWIGRLNGRTHLQNVATGSHGVARDFDGVPSLPTDDRFEELAACGRLVIRPAVTNERERRLAMTARTIMVRATASNVMPRDRARPTAVLEIR